MITATIENSTGTESLQIHSNSSDVGYFLVPPIQGLEFPSTRNLTIPRAQDHGAYLSSSYYGERRVTLQIYIHGSTLAQYNTRRRDLQKILRYELDSNGIPVRKVLKFTTDDSKTLQVNFILGSPLKLDILNRVHGIALVDLLCNDHYIESQTLNSQSFTTPGLGGFVLPAVLPVTFSAGAGASATVDNAGNGEAYPTITFTGPLTNPRLQNSTVSRELALTYSITSGDSIVIDVRNKTIIENSTTNRIDKKTAASKWWWLEPGDNDLFFGTSDSTDLGSAKIEWRDSYLGT